MSISILIGVMNSCKEDEGPETFSLKVQLKYPEGYQTAADVKVKLINTISGSNFEAVTNASGIAEFVINAGTYEAIAYETRTEGKDYLLFNGVKSNIVVTNTWTGDIVELTLTESKTSQLVIKELYFGGCPKNDGSGTFYNDKYVILYNNSETPVSLQNLCLGVVMPLNSNATNFFPKEGDKYIYEVENWIPAAYGLWAIENNVRLDPGKQIVIALENAVDNTLTYSNSINFANPEYYAAYDIAVWTMASYYPAPSNVIPTSHYLNGYKLTGVTSSAFTLSQISPGFFIFQTNGSTPSAFANDASKIIIHGTTASQANLKIPTEWVIDGIEVYEKGKANNKKRLTDAVDAGYIEFTNTKGYTVYRNVDKTLTEAVPENEGKIVYGYDKGTNGIVEGGSTDPSGIDAEASIKKGARIVYKDTNNSINDFHQRKQASLRD